MATAQGVGVDGSDESKKPTTTTKTKGRSIEEKSSLTTTAANQSQRPRRNAHPKKFYGDPDGESVVDSATKTPKKRVRQQSKEEIKKSKRPRIEAGTTSEEDEEDSSVKDVDESQLGTWMKKKLSSAAEEPKKRGRPAKKSPDKTKKVDDADISTKESPAANKRIFKKSSTEANIIGESSTKPKRAVRKASSAVENVGGGKSIVVKEEPTEESTKKTTTVGRKRRAAVVKPKEEEEEETAAALASTSTKGSIRAKKQPSKSTTKTAKEEAVSDAEMDAQETGQEAVETSAAVADRSMENDQQQHDGADDESNAQPAAIDRENSPEKSPQYADAIENLVDDENRDQEICSNESELINGDQVNRAENLISGDNQEEEENGIETGDGMVSGQEEKEAGEIITEDDDGGKEAGGGEEEESKVAEGGGEEIEHEPLAKAKEGDGEESNENGGDQTVPPASDISLLANAVVEELADQPTTIDQSNVPMESDDSPASQQQLDESQNDQYEEEDGDRLAAAADSIDRLANAVVKSEQYEEEEQEEEKIDQPPTPDFESMDDQSAEKQEEDKSIDQDERSIDPPSLDDQTGDQSMKDEQVGDEQSMQDNDQQSMHDNDQQMDDQALDTDRSMDQSPKIDNLASSQPSKDEDQSENQPSIDNDFGSPIDGQSTEYEEAIDQNRESPFKSVRSTNDQQQTDSPKSVASVLVRRSIRDDGSPTVQKVQKDEDTERSIGQQPIVRFFDCQQSMNPAKGQSKFQMKSIEDIAGTSNSHNAKPSFAQCSKAPHYESQQFGDLDDESKASILAGTSTTTTQFRRVPISSARSSRMGALIAAIPADADGDQQQSIDDPTTTGASSSEVGDYVCAACDKHVHGEKPNYVIIRLPTCGGCAGKCFDFKIEDLRE